MTIRAPKDFWSGIMFLAFAAVAILTARGYSLGTAGRMGPGYFPMLLGGILGGLGLVLIARSLVLTGEAVGKIQLLPLAIIIAGSVLFGILIQRLGLVIALIVVVIVSALASRESRPVEFIALALVLAAFSWAVFVRLLQLPLPLWPEF